MSDSPNRPIILLVDDAPENLAVLASALDSDFQIKVATSGARALRICEAEPQPELVLLDVMMPGMDGLTVCRHLKADVRTRHIAVIFVTAMAESQDEANGLAVGAVDYITKPISPAVVRQRVRVHLELKQARQSLERLGRHYQSYLSTEVAQSIQRGETPSGLMSRKKTLSVMFADIVGFTALTDRVHPALMTELLNSYFDAMSAVVSQQQGTLDKFIGDACMVFFGDPQTRGAQEDAIACVQTALDMMKALEPLQSDWSVVSDGVPLRMHVGIASGPCIVGNFGSKRQLTYTALGSTVNLASRLETKAEPNAILISQETYDLVNREFTCQPQLPLYVKGIERPLNTYVVSGRVSRA